MRMRVEFFLTSSRSMHSKPQDRVEKCQLPKCGASHCLTRAAHGPCANMHIPTPTCKSTVRKVIAANVRCIPVDRCPPNCCDESCDMVCCHASHVRAGLQVIVGVSVVLSLARPRRTPRWRLLLKARALPRDARRLMLTNLTAPCSAV